MTQATPQPATAPLLFGRYRVQEQLGEGRLATVYRATDERLQRTVLVHLLRKELVGQEPLRQRFLDEAGASARRSHQALLEVFDSGEVSGRPFMVTEYAAGRTLRVIGILALEDALLYMRQVVGAVAACQNMGVAHPPISSSNVLLVDEGRVKLIESWLTPPEAVALDLAHYRPPERTQGQPASPANVVYSLGLLLYELITGQRPVGGDDPRTVAQAHLAAHIPALGAVRPLLYLPSLDQLLARATARTPLQRLPNAAAFAEALDELRREVGADTRQLVVTQPPRPRRFRRGGEDADLRNVPTPPISSPTPRPLAPEPQPDLGRSKVRRQGLRRAVAGWFVAVILLLGVAYGSYVGASFMVSQLFGARLPQINLPIPSLPEWFGGTPQEVLIVNIAEGLNLRDNPGLNTQIVAIIPNGSRVQKFEGPTTVDDVQWVRVQGEVNGQPFEGWMSLKFLEPE